MSRKPTSCVDASSCARHSLADTSTPVQSIRTLCSGYATVFSSLGEVYAWLGEGSTDLERHTACEFAESLADGRSVAVLAEGEETALFWHQLAADAGAEYASAHVRLDTVSPSCDAFSAR